MQKKVKKLNQITSLSMKGGWEVVFAVALLLPNKLPSKKD